MSNLQNEILLENLYDEAWEDYRKEHNLTDDQLYALEQNSDNGILLEIEAETNKRFWELAQ
tara:strand:+ start:361 stop:543 length:183 start_codon:yes stop_codon:yes gene_type:complete